SDSWPAWVTNASLSLPLWLTPTEPATAGSPDALAKPDWLTSDRLRSPDWLTLRSPDEPLCEASETLLSPPWLINACWLLVWYVLPALRPCVRVDALPTPL